MVQVCISDDDSIEHLRLLPESRRNSRPQSCANQISAFNWPNSQIQYAKLLRVHNKIPQLISSCSYNVIPLIQRHKI